MIFGALLSGIVNTNTLLLGCSGGDYCLILASFANILLNLDHMHWLGFLIRFFPVALYVTFDIYETYQRYIRLTIIDILMFEFSKLITLCHKVYEPKIRESEFGTSQLRSSSWRSFCWAHIWLCNVEELQAETMGRLRLEDFYSS